MLHRRTKDLLEMYTGYLPVLEPFCAERDGEEGKKVISSEALADCFCRLREAADDLDMDRMEEVIQEMNRYHYDGWQQELFELLKDAVEEVDVEQCGELMLSWEERLLQAEGKQNS